MQKQHNQKNMPQRGTYNSFNLSSFICIPCLIVVSPFLFLCFLYKLPLLHQNMKNWSLIINVTWNIHLLKSYSTFSRNCHTISELLPRIPTISVQTRPHIKHLSAKPIKMIEYKAFHFAQTPEFEENTDFSYPENHRHNMYP